MFWLIFCLPLAASPRLAPESPPVFWLIFCLPFAASPRLAPESPPVFWLVFELPLAASPLVGQVGVEVYGDASVAGVEEVDAVAREGEPGFDLLAYESVGAAGCDLGLGFD